MSKDKQKKAERATTANLEASLAHTRDLLWKAQSHLSECERSLEVVTGELVDARNELSALKSSAELSKKHSEAEIDRLRAMIQGYINPGSNLPKRGEINE